jgi:hypothetical protein
MVICEETYEESVSLAKACTTVNHTILSDGVSQ